jgi:hypothetical protein
VEQRQPRQLLAQLVKKLARYSEEMASKDLACGAENY